MPARMLPHRLRAHRALMDWAQSWINFTEGNFYAVPDWGSLARLGSRIQMPHKASLPKGVQFSADTVRSVDAWFTNGASRILKTNAVKAYCLGEKLTRRQQDHLLNSVSEYLKTPKRMD
jgi:hypothetical protein